MRKRRAISLALSACACATTTTTTLLWTASLPGATGAPSFNTDVLTGIEYAPERDEGGGSAADAWGGGDDRAEPGLRMASPEERARQRMTRAFERDVIRRFAGDPRARVEAAKRGRLTCRKLAAGGALKSVTIEWRGRPIVLRKLAYQHFPEFEGRHVFMGRLEGVGDDGAALVGTGTVTWDDDCDPATFHLSVVMNDLRGHSHALKSLPCGREEGDGGEAPPPTGCTWIASIKTEARDELDGHRRRLSESHDADSDAEDTATSTSASTSGSASSVLWSSTTSTTSTTTTTNTTTTSWTDDDDEDALDDTATAAPTPSSDPSFSLPGPDVSSFQSRRKALSDVVIVRVLWLYTPASQLAWGDAKLRSMITAGIVTANAALAQSRTGLKLQAAGISVLKNYDVNDHILALADLSDNKIPAARRRRDATRADLVQLVLEDNKFCGYGQLMQDTGFNRDYAVSTVYSQCFTSYSHVHEIGHNLGCKHDTSNSGENSWPYAYGKRYCDFEGAFRTIMSYGCPSSTRVPFFSNPDVYHMGLPTGSNLENNARVLRETRFVAAAFQP